MAGGDGSPSRAPIRFVVACVCVGVAAFALPPAASPEAETSCARVASPTGSDSASGTAANPYATARRLVNSLAPGQTGCLGAGTYAQEELTLATPGVRLTSIPGERATLVGRLRVTADGITVDRLRLDGRNLQGLPSPSINADDVAFRRNDVLSPHSASCFILGSTTEVRHILIKGNRIHDCGVPGSVYDHGIYLQDMNDAKIVGNTIYDNASRGIKIGPDAQEALIRRNVIDGNAIGLNFSGDDTSASSGNVVERNVIANSTGFWNVQSYWPGPVGGGNLVRGNCLHGGNPNPRYNQGGGVSNEDGFTAEQNLIAVPRYVNRKAEDFRLRRNSPCRAAYRSAAGRPGYASPLVGAIIELGRLIGEAIGTLEA